MKPYKVFFIILILAVSFQVCAAQKSNAILIDRFEKITCEDDSARADQLAVQLQNNPQVKGYFVIYWEKTDASLRKFFYEQRLKNYLYLARGIDQNRIDFLRGENKEERQVEYWVAENESAAPEFIKGEWAYALPDKKAYQFYSSRDDSGVCSSVFDLKLYADFLSANPEKRGHIVVVGSSTKEIQKTKNAISKELFNKYKIPHKRIRFFFDRDNNYQDYTTEEYWFVRPKK